MIAYIVDRCPGAEHFVSPCSLASLCLVFSQPGLVCNKIKTEILVDQHLSSAPLCNSQHVDLVTAPANKLGKLIAAADEGSVLDELVELYSQAFAQREVEPRLTHEDQLVVDYCCAELARAADAVMSNRFLDAKICALNVSKATSARNCAAGNPVAKALIAKQIAPTQVCPFLAHHTRALTRRPVLGGEAALEISQQLPVTSAVGGEATPSVESRIKEFLQLAKSFGK